MTDYCFTEKDIQKKIKGNVYNGDLYIRGDYINKLNKVHIITGSFGLSDCVISDLGELKKINKNFYISSSTRKSNVKSLNKIEFIGGDLSLRHSSVSDLGCLQKVEGTISLRDTKIKDLKNLRYVGGNLNLPDSLRGVDLSTITIKGKVKYYKPSEPYIHYDSKESLAESNKTEPYWAHTYIYDLQNLNSASKDVKLFYKYFKNQFLNDSPITVKSKNYVYSLYFDLIQKCSLDDEKIKKLSDYYPYLKSFILHNKVESFRNSNQHEKAWILEKERGLLSISTVYDYQQKLKKNLLTGNLITKLAGITYLTEFGKKNLDKIEEFVLESLDNYLKEKKSKDFFSLFLRDGKPIKEKKILAKKTFFGLIETKKKIHEYSSNYYKDFFLSDRDFNFFNKTPFYKSHTFENEKIINFNLNLVYNAMIHQMRLILRDAENLYRESVDMPKIGEGWISETELYYNLVSEFKNDKIIRHAKPKWLGRQHLDIYFPEYNIAVEYQGDQHFKPIDFFGGQEAFEENVKRDQRKKQLCEENDCFLFCVEKNYDFESLVSTIQNIIDKINK